MTKMGQGHRDISPLVMIYSTPSYLCPVNDTVDAQDPWTDPRRLRVLAGDVRWHVRLLVARNPSTPSDVLERLAQDEDYCIRAAVASNPNTPEDILRRLAGDERWEVREAVARNPRTPVDVLEKLAVDDNDEVVRNEALRNLDCPPKSHARAMLE